MSIMYIILVLLQIIILYPDKIVINGNNAISDDAFFDDFFGDDDI